MIGKQISHYYILEKLGEGGMGIVYKAEDTKLHRIVALKFFSPNFVGDGEEKERFIREAQVAASLNHANIAYIHEIDEADGQIFLAMEYIEGRSLQDMIMGTQYTRPLRLDDALNYATQIANGLQAAHEKGIVHRDIKSANIMVTDKGHVKIMDFGLAKLTNRSMLTKAGTTLGTTAYMSPEQAWGEEVDHRTDIWALGVVLYEMISGQLPFKGDSEQVVINLIQTINPEPLTTLRSGLPIAIDGVISKALAKETQVRYQHVDELTADLVGMDKISTSSTGISPQGRAQKNTFRMKFKGNLWLKVGAFLAGIFLASLWWWLNIPDTAFLRKSKFNIDGIPESRFMRNATISPNGEMVAFIQYGGLWIRDLKQLQARPIVDTQRVFRIFWSPNSEYIAYLDQEDKKFKKVNIQSGSIKVICDFDYGHYGYGEAWKKDGTIIIAVPDGSLFAVSEDGGKLTAFPKQDTVKIELGTLSCTVLPNGTLLAVHEYLNSTASQLIKINGSTKTSIDGIPKTEIRNLAYSPSGHLIYNDNHGLWAMPFSTSEPHIKGKPFLIDPIGVGASVSNTGTLVYSRDESLGEQLLLVDRKGFVTDTLGQIQDRILDPAVSPGGDRIAVSGREKGNWDIWIHDIMLANKERQTFSHFRDTRPLWHPGENSLIFGSRRISDGAIFVKAINSNGVTRQILTGPFWSYEPTMSQLANYMVYTCWTDGIKEAESELWYLSFETSSQPEVFLSVGARIMGPELSPDGRYLAYHSEESGQYEVYVIKFPGKEFRKKISVNGGQWPKWNATGDELFYCNNNAIMAVKLNTDSIIAVIEKPKELFKGARFGTELIRQDRTAYDVMPDGRHFVVVQPIGKKQSEIIVVQNWFKEFEQTE